MLNSSCGNGMGYESLLPKHPVGAFNWNKFCVDWHLARQHRSRFTRSHYFKKTSPAVYWREEFFQSHRHDYPEGRLSRGNDKGWQFVFLLRLCFLIPFNVSNYVFGVSSIKLKDFVLGGFGTLPFVFFEIYTGACATEIQKAISGKQNFGSVKIAVMVASCVLGVFVVVYVTKRVKRQL